MNLDTNNQGWDGTINGKNYLQQIIGMLLLLRILTAMLSLKGHFSLIR